MPARCSIIFAGSCTHVATVCRDLLRFLLVKDVSAMAASVSRRSVLTSASFAATAAYSRAGLAAVRPRGKATSCIFIWLGGGAAQIDTWDPKAVGDPAQGARKPGSAYSSIPTAMM